MSGEFTNTVDRAVIEACSAMRLGLQSYADMFDRPGDDGISYAGKGAGEIVLWV